MEPFFTPAEQFRLFLRALRDVNSNFDLFMRVAEPTAISLTPHFYASMPQRGPSSRCALWRRLLQLAAEAAGDPVLDPSDEAIVRAVRSFGLPI